MCSLFSYCRNKQCVTMVKMYCFIYAVFQVSVMVTFGVIEPQSRTLQNGIGLPDLQSCMKGLKYKTCSFTQIYLKSHGFHLCKFFNNSIEVHIEFSLSLGYSVFLGSF